MHRALAFIAFCATVVALVASHPGEARATQQASRPLATGVCSTDDLKDIVSVYGFDSTTYKKAAETAPAGVKSYLTRVLYNRLLGCASHVSLAAAPACVPNPRETDPQALWRQLTFCQGVMALEDPPKPDPLIVTREPTLYVLIAVGGGSGGGSGGTSPAKTGAGAGGGGKSGGPATGSTATGSAVDNPANFLLFIVAQRLQEDVCARSGLSASACDAQHPVAVVPEADWTLEDLSSQCAGDPYVPDDPANPYGVPGSATQAGHGTLGAIVLNGSTVTADGTFAVFTVYGSSEANYTAQVLDCKPGPSNSLTAVWSDSISNGNKTTALSFFPIALAGTLITANAAARTAAAPAPTSSSPPNALPQFINYQSDIALGTFASNSSSLALGNPSSGLTFRHTFEAWANTLSTNLGAYCKNNPAEVVCKILHLQ